MRKWEDIVKDKLEGYESALPEGSLAAWRARRDGADAPEAGRFPWAWVAAAAVAAGLAAVLFLRPPGTPAKGVRVEPQPASPVAVVGDAAAGNTSGVAMADDAAAGSTSGARVPAASQVVSAATRGQAVTQDETGTNGKDAPVTQGSGSGTTVTVIPDVEEQDASPYVPGGAARRPVQVKVVPVAGAVAGGGLLAALGTALIGGKQYDSGPVIQGDEYGDSEPPKDVLTGDPVHRFPLKTGLSLRIPVTERVFVTTGLEYALYRSSFTYSLSGEKKQVAQYLGVPVRVDWAFVSGRRLEAYVGGGVQGDVCVGATLAGEKIPKDGFSLALLGAGGIQMNVSKRLGLYVEPQLSWRMFAGQQVITSYRSEHPLMLSIATGFRITL